LLTDSRKEAQALAENGSLEDAGFGRGAEKQNDK
jgi:hypothetical protein